MVAWVEIILILVTLVVVAVVLVGMAAQPQFTMWVAKVVMA
jgi:hypothetical protein